MLKQFIRKCTMPQLFGVAALSFLSLVFGISTLLLSWYMIHKYSSGPADTVWTRTAAELGMLFILLVETFGSALLACVCIRNSVKS